jgi:hypothetical protein
MTANMDIPLLYAELLRLAITPFLTSLTLHTFGEFLNLPL